MSKLMIHQSRLTVVTRGYRHMQDITEQVAEVVQRSRVRTGIVHLFHLECDNKPRQCEIVMTVIGE